MISECGYCDRPAVAYWGEHAYCKKCLAYEKEQEPLAHLCITCGKEQPTNVSWQRNAPCKECQK